MKKYYLFLDTLCGESAIFDSKEKLDAFKKEWVCNIINEGFDVDESDYKIDTVELNPDFKKWFNS